MIEEAPLKFLIREEWWQIRKTDPDRFKSMVREYVGRGYPGWKVINAKYPFVYLQKDEAGDKNAGWDTGYRHQKRKNGTR